MKAEIKKKWTDALRSGEYTQGKDNLAKSDREGVTKYCCLGVLCAIAVEEGVVGPPEVGLDGLYEFAGATTYLPNHVLDWAGRDIRESTVLGAGYPGRHGQTSTNTVTVQEALTRLNDAGKSFDEIADEIEKLL